MSCLMGQIVINPAQTGGRPPGSGPVPACPGRAAGLDEPHRGAAQRTEKSCRRPQSHWDRACQAPRTTSPLFFRFVLTCVNSSNSINFYKSIEIIFWPHSQLIFVVLVTSFMLRVYSANFLPLLAAFPPQQVLQIDVLAHKSTVETVNKAGNELVESSAGEEASSLQSKLENLNQRWKAILEKTEQRKQQLESSLLQVTDLHLP